MTDQQEISLIANSGIQFLHLHLTIDPNADVIRNIAFWEKVDFTHQRISLEFARYLGEFEMYTSLRQLEEDGYLDPKGQLLEEVNPNMLTALDPEQDCYSINGIDLFLKTFENEWLPLPYFNYNGEGKFVLGPTNWCRLKLIPLETNSRLKEYEAILIYDTTLASHAQDNDAPLLPEQEESMRFMVCNDQKLLLNYCDERYGGGWVQAYLDTLLYGGSDNLPDSFPVLRHIGYYVYFVKYLAELHVFPKITLYANHPEEAIDVDMILDIGNSRTCGLLMETPRDESFTFDRVKKLAIRDLSQPTQTYQHPFDMRLAFHQATFGEIGFNNTRFLWPSFIRVGDEAFRLIHQPDKDEVYQTGETLTNHSSPKRYLWDENASRIQWRLINNNGAVGNHRNDSIYIRGISEQFTRSGSLAKNEDEIFGVTNNFSRKSLMTFVCLEILAHATVQVNSFEFRDFHGSHQKPRRIRSLTVTCPTAMSQEEQLALRKCASDAALALNRFYQSGGALPIHTTDENPGNIQVIPAVSDLKKDLSRIEEKKDWIYDEATCCQLVFLYAEISKRYLNKCERYFDLYGKVRQDLSNYNKKSITIGSIDIGGGTTDLMISAYQYDESGIAVLTPIPLFWESFYHAGDNLTKEIVKQIIIEGRVKEEKFLGCTGVIMNGAQDRGIPDIESKINNFFGPASNNMGYKLRQLRKKFNVQISIPIAERYLAHAQALKADENVAFDDLFAKHRPNQDILDYFEQHFGYRFEELKWKLSTERVNQIVEIVFEPMIRQICSLLFIKGCDFVLLAGRPTSLKKINDLLLKFYPVSPDRMISLNEYRVGRWYPFQDGNGYFTDKKSIVAVGASIALLGGKMNKLKGFRLNMDPLKKRLISTAEHFGIYDTPTSSIEKIFINPDNNTNNLQVEGLPMNIGFKMLDARTYPGRMLYVLDFDEDKIRERHKLRFPDLHGVALEDDITNYKNNLIRRMPFKMRIVREYRTNREKLVIDSIEDQAGEMLPKSIFQLRLQTLDEEQGYWLDTGEFNLSIQARD